jgi:hypothetical protein
MRGDSPPQALQEFTIHTSAHRRSPTALCSLAIALALAGWTACGPPTPAGAAPAPDAPARHPVALTLGLTFDEDLADDEVFPARWRTLVARVSNVLWNASEGQLFVGRCTLADRADWGELRVPHGALEQPLLASGAPFELRSPGAESWHVLCAGWPADDEATALSLAADVLRGAYGLDPHGAPDDGAGPGCLLAGTATRLCGDDEPRLARRSCRSVIDARWQGLASFPNPGWTDEEPAPSTAFERLRESP